MRSTLLGLTTALLTLPVLALPALAKTDITLALQQEPPSLDPTADATASIDGMLTQNVYESLTSVTEQGEVIPALATDWSVSEDGLTYVFTLAADVRYHDGTPFDAEDVKFSFDRAMAENSTNPSKGIFAPIESVTVTGPLEVTIKLKRPDAFFLFNMSQGDISIVAPESAAGNANTPIGTGPYKMDSWTRGDRLVLKKNPDYRHADKVEMTSVTFRFINDPVALTSALMAGEVDGTTGFPAPELLAQFESDPRYTVSVGTTQGEVILALNNGEGPFTDIKARRAVSHALDRKEIIDGAMYGYATPIGSFFPPSDVNYVDLTGHYALDPDQARALFKEAGLDEKREIRLRIPPFTYATRSAVIIQAQMAKAGLNVKIEQMEWSAWFDQVFTKKDYDMAIIAHTAPNDLGNFARDKSYFYGYENAAFKDLWTRITSEPDAAKRGELLKEAQRFVTDEAVHGFLFQMPSLGIFRKELQGAWKSTPVLFHPLSGLTWVE